MKEDRDREKERILVFQVIPSVSLAYGPKGKFGGRGEYHDDSVGFRSHISHNVSIQPYIECMAMNVFFFIQHEFLNTDYVFFN